MKSTSDGSRLAAPEGGWGWMVVVSVAICNITAVPSMVLFAFIFKDIAIDLNLSVMNIASILIINSGLGLVLTVAVDHLLPRFSLRKAAFCGAFLVVAGFVGTAFSQNYYQVICSYGIVLAVGMKLLTSSCMMCMNLYFVKKRRKAMQICMLTFTFGCVAMPQIMAFLAATFTAREAVFILGGLALHTLLAAFFLQPIRKHLVEEFVDQEMTAFVDDKSKGNETSNREVVPESPTHVQLTSPTEKCRGKETRAIVNSTEMYILVPQKEKPHPLDFQAATVTRASSSSSVGRTSISGTNKYVQLLVDARYLCITTGLILNTVAEGIFSAILPFMLYQFGFETGVVAIGISCFAMSMNCTKYVFTFHPPKGSSPQIISILSIVLLIACRVGISLGLLHDFKTLLTAATVIGAGKGLLQAFIENIIPNIYTKDMLPFANDIQNLSSGFTIIVFGPVLGYLRDITGNYQMPMFSINAMNSVCIILWTVELIVSVIFDWYRYRRTEDAISAA